MRSHRDWPALLVLMAGIAFPLSASAQVITEPGRIFGDDNYACPPFFPNSVTQTGLVWLGRGSPGVPPAPGAAADGSTNNEPQQLLNAAPGGFVGDTVIVGRPKGSDGPINTSHLFADPLQYNDSVPKAEPPVSWRLFEAGPDFIEFPHKPLSRLFGFLVSGEPVDPHTELEHRPIGLQSVPERPPLIIETDEPFLAPGRLQQGIELPSGAIWRPALWVFGTYRNGFQYLDTPTGTRIGEWAHRLDLFAQVNFTGTERLLFGMRPLDQEVGSGREFNSYDFRAGNSIDGWNGEVQTLFFEGDFGEIFPRLDPLDSEHLDVGFSVGRMPLLAQQGLFINEDKIDALTITRNTLYGPGLLNLRMTGVYAWDEVNRNNNAADDDAQLFAILTESDIASSTVNADLAYVKSSAGNGDQIAWAVSGIQRFHGFHNTYNSSLHFLSSHALNGESPLSGNGELFFSQFSWTPHHSHDLIYVNGFWAIDQFTSPARGSLAGGPLGQTGVLFSAPGLGRIGAPLSNQASNTAGGSIGYQMFFDETRKQVVFEVGGRVDTINSRGRGDMGAVGARYQQAFGQHVVLIMDGILAKTEGSGLVTVLRVEALVKF